MSLIKVNQLATLDGATNREVTANTGLTIPVGEDLKISGSIIDSTGNNGDTGQYLTAINNGSQVSWTSLPQSISPTSDVTFRNVTITGNVSIGGTANFGLLDDSDAIVEIVSTNPLTNLVVDNNTESFSISNITVGNNGISTVTTTSQHNLEVGDRISIKNSSNGDINGIYTILSTPQPTNFTFTINVTDPDVEPGLYSNGSVLPIAVFTGDVIIDGSLSLGGGSIVTGGGGGSTGSASTFGASGDEDLYSVSAVTNVTSGSQSFIKLNVNDVSKFDSNHQVKVFGISPVALASIPNSPAPTSATPIVGDIATYNISPKRYYVYATSNFSLTDGWYTAAKSNTSCIALNVVSNLIDENNYNSVVVSRNPGNGVLLYRAEYTTLTTAQAAAGLSGAFPEDFKLCAIIGPRIFGNSNTIAYNDFADFDRTSWSDRNVNGTYKQSTLHFSSTAPTINYQGWATTGIFNIDPSDNSFWLSRPNLFSDGLTPDPTKVKVYHDDTKALQDAIDEASSSGLNYLVIPGGTYLVSKLKIPSSFSLSGYGEATVLKKQYWDTESISSAVYDGAKASIIVSSAYNNTVPEVDALGNNVWGLKKVNISDITIDGNSVSQIQFGSSSLGEEANNSLVHLVNSEFIRLQNTKITRSSGPAIFSTGSKNLTINSCLINDGSDIEFFVSPCVISQDCETTVVSNTVFQNFPGAVDFSTNTVLSVTGCTIRNCGTGLRVFGSAKTDVLNNLILGPSDEFIPVPETTDTEYNGVNISVVPGRDAFTPVYQYNISGQEVDLSDVVPNKIKLEVYPVNVVTSGGVSQDIIDFDNPIRDSGGNQLYSYFNPNLEDDPALGQVRFKLPASKSSIISLENPPGPNTFNVYEVTAIKYTDIGDDTTAGQVLSNGQALNVPSNVGAIAEDVGLNSYYLSVDEILYIGVVQGDFIKLIAHNYQPDVGTDVVWKVAGKVQISTTQFFLYLLPHVEDVNGELTSVPFGGLSQSPSLGGGYAQFREIFSIARGIVSIV